MPDQLDRSWPLTVFLVVVGGLAAFSIGTYTLMWNTMLRQFPAWVVVVLLAASCLRLVAVIAIWNWIREGVVGYALLTVVVIPVTYTAGYRSTIVSLLGIALLAYLIRNRWADMRWALRSSN